MADDDAPVYNSGDEALADSPTPAQKDPGETAPEIPEDAQGVGEGDQEAIAAQQKQRVMQEDLDQTQRSREAVTKLQNTTAPMWEKYREMAQQDQQAASSPPEQQPIPPPPTEQKNNFIGALATMLAVAVPIALAFGKKGNGYAQGAMMLGLGSAMKNFMQGREQAGEQDMKQWHAQVQAIHESNQDRMKIYKDILSNKKLELDDQFKMINAVSHEFMQPYMARAAQRKDMNSTVKELEKMEKIDKAFVKGTGRIAKKVRPRDWAEYRQDMIDMFKIDPDKDPDKAANKMSHHDWQMKYGDAAARKKTRASEEPKSAEDLDAPPSEDEAAKIRAKILD